ncbi:MAG: hypothetical protein ACRCYU_11530 [Nocardioides sp.]
MTTVLPPAEPLVTSTDAVLMLGYAAGLAVRLDASLPAGSVLVVEEPDVARRRDLHATASAACVSRVVECEYQLDGPLDALLDRLPQPQIVLTGVEYGARAAERGRSSRSAQPTLRDRRRP